MTYITKPFTLGQPDQQARKFDPARRSEPPTAEPETEENFGLKLLRAIESDEARQTKVFDPFRRAPLPVTKEADEPEHQAGLTVPAGKFDPSRRRSAADIKRLREQDR